MNVIKFEHLSAHSTLKSADIKTIIMRETGYYSKENVFTPSNWAFLRIPEREGFLCLKIENKTPSYLDISKPGSYSVKLSGKSTCSTPQFIDSALKVEPWLDI